MKQSTINFLLGLGAFAGFCFGAYGLYKATTVQNAFVSKVNDVTGQIEVDIPESVVQAATNKALNKAVESVAAHETALVRDTVKTMVAGAVKAESATVKDKVSKAITDQVKNIDISGMRKQVIDDVSKQAFKEVMGGVRTFIKSGTSDTTDAVAIVEACAEAGMDSYDIEKVLKAAKS